MMPPKENTISSQGEYLAGISSGVWVVVCVCVCVCILKDLGFTSDQVFKM